MKHVLNYLKGLGCFYIMVLVFAGMGWVSVDQTWYMRIFIVPLGAAAITWTIVYVARTLLYNAASHLASVYPELRVAVTLIGIAAAGYYSFSVADFVIPPRMFSASQALDPLVVGAVAVLVNYGLSPKKSEKVKT